MTQVADTAIHQLEEVFTAFNRVSSELGSRYQELESQLAMLHRELAGARSARHRDLAEKERLAGRLSALMDALPGGVLVLNAADEITEENPAAARILGASYLGRTWREALRHSAGAEALYHGELSLRDSKRVSVSSSGADANGENIILLTDVSESHRLNDRINRDKRLAALGEMSARLAHQVRTPLSSAILYLSHLSASRGEAGAREEVIAKILERLRQIESLIESMLRFIRDGITTSEHFSLNDLLLDIREAGAPQLRQAGARLSVDLPWRDCAIRGNREALFNALLNLLDNAVQAAGDKPVVKLALAISAHHYTIRVQDNGPGIDASIRESIFDPFFSTRAHGTGLGLAVVASAVKAHGGEIHVADAPGQGTVFQLNLPHAAGDGSRDCGLWGEGPSLPAPAHALKEYLHG